MVALSADSGITDVDFLRRVDYVGIEAILHIGSLIFILALFGLVLNHSSVMLYMVGLEMLMLSCGFNYVIFSLYLNQLEGFVIALVILGIAASETAIGLGIIVACYGRSYSLNMLDFEKSGGL